MIGSSQRHTRHIAARERELLSLLLLVVQFELLEPLTLELLQLQLLQLLFLACLFHNLEAVCESLLAGCQNRSVVRAQQHGIRCLLVLLERCDRCLG